MIKPVSPAMVDMCHPACVVCGTRNATGLGLRFVECGDEAVTATFACPQRYQGYPDRLHGGVIAMLLDAAMTHCLFAKGIQAVTARLDLRYRHPVQVDREAVVRAQLVNRYPPLYTLKAELVQEDVVCASAEAKFYGAPPDRRDEDAPSA